MGLKSLLLSKDTEAVQVLTRALGDLGVAVEHCTEPFSAAKRLMDQRFDAIIVDCDDAQGAGWVLQSARMAAANKGSLTIAVQGQTPRGNLKLGENFLLQKPLIPKQVDATLKTAHG